MINEYDGNYPSDSHQSTGDDARLSKDMKHPEGIYKDGAICKPSMLGDNIQQSPERGGCSQQYKCPAFSDRCLSADYRDKCLRLDEFYWGENRYARSNS